MLLTHWFEIQIMRSNRSQCSIANQTVPAFGQPESRHGLKSSYFSLISFGTLVAPRTRRSNEMAPDLPCWERDVGTRQAVIKEHEICVETRFEHR
jgi:hypothetical protein